MSSTKKDFTIKKNPNLLLYESIGNNNYDLKRKVTYSPFKIFMDELVHKEKNAKIQNCVYYIAFLI